MKNNFLSTIIIISILIFGATLPFHWVISDLIVVPKKNLTFDKTFVTDDEVQEIVEKYYLGSPKEKFEVENDPLTEKLVKLWKVYRTSDGTVVFEGEHQTTYRLNH